MLERALTTIENATRDGNLVFIDILFEVAKRWYEMYYERTGDSLNSEDDSTVVDIRQTFDNNPTITVANPIDLHWAHTNGTNPSTASSSPSPMMYATNNQNTNFQTPFQPHPSTHFNTHAFMIQAQHGPLPPPPPPSMHHHQLGNFHQQVPYQQIIPIQYSSQQQQQQQHFAFHTGPTNNFHPHPHHPRHPPPPQMANAILVTPGNFPTAYTVHHATPTGNPQMYSPNPNQQQTFYPVRQIPLVVSPPTEPTVSPSASTTTAATAATTTTTTTQQTNVISPSTTPSAEVKIIFLLKLPNHLTFSNNNNSNNSNKLMQIIVNIY
jgi:hypothetical protein